jgi:hypothetical protein
MAAPEPGAPPAIEMPAPPKVDPDAPYGRTKDGQPKKGPGGRPAKDADKPRVTIGTAGADSAGEPVDFTHGLMKIGGLVHLGMIAAPPLHPQAALWKGALPEMVQAWNYAAQCNAHVRVGVEWLANSDIGWIAAVSLATLPVLQGGLELWQNPKSEVAQTLRMATEVDIQRARDAQAAAMLQMAGVPQATAA